MLLSNCHYIYVIYVVIQLLAMVNATNHKCCYPIAGYDQGNLSYRLLSHCYHIYHICCCSIAIMYIIYIVMQLLGMVKQPMNVVIRLLSYMSHMLSSNCWLWSRQPMMYVIIQLLSYIS